MDTKQVNFFDRAIYWLQTIVIFITILISIKTFTRFTNLYKYFVPNRLMDFIMIHDQDRFKPGGASKNKVGWGKRMENL